MEFRPEFQPTNIQGLQGPEVGSREISPLEGLPITSGSTASMDHIKGNIAEARSGPGSVLKNVSSKLGDDLDSSSMTREVVGKSQMEGSKQAVNYGLREGLGNFLGIPPLT